MNLLLIEDNPGDAGLIERAFRGLCDIVDHATTMAQGRKMLSSNRYDFTIVDPGLPNSHGIEAVLDLLEYQVPVIVLTGFGEVSDVQIAIRKGLAGYWTKNQLQHPDFAWGVLVAVEQFSEVRKLKNRVEQLEAVVGELETVVSEYETVKQELLKPNASSA